MSQILTIERIKKIVGQKKVPDWIIDQFNRNAINAYSANRHSVCIYYSDNPKGDCAKHKAGLIGSEFVRPLMMLLKSKGYHTELKYPSKALFITYGYLEVWLDNSWLESKKSSVDDISLLPVSKERP